MKKWVIEDKKENYRKIIQENQISNFLAIILGNRGIVKKEEIEIFSMREYCCTVTAAVRNWQNNM